MRYTIVVAAFLLITIVAQESKAKEIKLLCQSSNGGYWNIIADEERNYIKSNAFTGAEWEFGIGKIRDGEKLWAMFSEKYIEFGYGESLIKVDRETGVANGDSMCEIDSRKGPKF